MNEYSSVDCYKYYKGNFQGTTKRVEKYRFREKKCKFNIFYESLGMYLEVALNSEFSIGVQ